HQLAPLPGRDRGRSQAGRRHLCQTREFAGPVDYAGRSKVRSGGRAVGRSVGRFASGLLLCCWAAGAWAQEYPKTPPPPAPLTSALFPPFQESVLPNGLRLLVVESHKQPVVSLSLSFAAGSSRDPEGKEGLAEMVAGLLTKGAG